MKMYEEAAPFHLEDRSNSCVRSFKIFKDRAVFPQIYEDRNFA